MYPVEEEDLIFVLEGRFRVQLAYGLRIHDVSSRSLLFLEMLGLCYVLVAYLIGVSSLLVPIQASRLRLI